ncbi:DUF4344 domain-containing metallopeptidase [Streptomyces sp. YGL11-2]|uniref:DUF4344 domain-containing metallopeptidase n=1 Tax=Streptomyces sp. YGL11-2 TaxID=3414028 RepID=UPI003CE876DC
MSRRAGIGTLALLTLAVSGCAADPDAADEAPRRTHGKNGSGGFTVQYRTGGKDARATTYLRSRQVLEKAVDRLNDTVTVPRRIPLVVRSCGAAEPAYDPETGSIDFCVEHVSEVREHSEDTGKDVDEDERAARVTGVLTETAYHEGAHALIDTLGLHFTGREEDVADQFAAVMLVRQGRSGEDGALAAAADYELSAKENPADDTDLRDEHALDGQRAANYACYVYGAHPARHRDLVRDGTLTEDRADGCPDEWKQAKKGWEMLLGPHLKKRL